MIYIYEFDKVCSNKKFFFCKKVAKTYYLVEISTSKSSVTAYMV